MSGHLRSHKFGQRAYLVGIGNFFPWIEEAFFKAVSEGDIAKAAQIVDVIEKPYFDVAVNIGWHTSLKQALFVACQTAPWERKPLSRVSDDDARRIRAAVEDITSHAQDILELS